MLIDVKTLKELYPEFADINEMVLKRKLDALELSIRRYTNNNFQNRAIRGLFYSKGQELVAMKEMPPLRVNDTIQISVSRANKGLCVITKIEGTTIMVDRDLYDTLDNLVTKIEYPLDVVEGAINLLRWDCFDREKVGVASETISRHSVSYQQYDGTNTIDGYPAMLFGFCSLYMRART